MTKDAIVRDLTATLGEGPPGEGSPRGAQGPLYLIHTTNCSSPEKPRVSGALTMPFEPWKQGFQAGQTGRAECPYDPVSREAWAWSAGYIEGRAANAKPKSTP